MKANLSWYMCEYASKYRVLQLLFRRSNLTNCFSLKIQLLSSGVTDYSVQQKKENRILGAFQINRGIMEERYVSARVTTFCKHTHGGNISYTSYLRLVHGISGHITLTCRSLGRLGK
jgi:hypothetical protein